MKVCSIEKGQQNDFKILGTINFDTVTHLYKKGIELFTDSVEVRLDFTEVLHADSSAISLLLNWLRFAKQQQKNFIFLNIPSQLLEIANVCEVMPLLNKYIEQKTPV